MEIREQWQYDVSNETCMSRGKEFGLSLLRHKWRRRDRVVQVTDNGKVATMPDSVFYPALKYFITIEVIFRRVHRAPAEPEAKAQLG